MNSCIFSLTSTYMVSTQLANEHAVFSQLKLHYDNVETYFVN